VGLGKKRSKLGKWLDRQGYTQEELTKEAIVRIALLFKDRNHSIN
jgi:hypothetical protein